ncbi:hypothetical protein [Butyrivibrio sp. MC2013]|uniref:hypothetical protein n=1 Tax=Butyrivibrio sp. MC2013 TaxID=1280686 RepID=UPI00040D5AF8|nr:hypothetical protein [Butyrivibrio sp. MC2013]
MGSGDYGPYGKSQPFSSTYHVVKSMLKQDKEKGIYNGYYQKNPTANKLVDMINGNYIGNKHNTIDMPYVIAKNGDIIVGKRNGNGKDGLPTPHPTLIGGKDPEVIMAGIVHIHGGKIASYDSNSGHFKPNSKSMAAAEAAFSKLPNKLFKKKRG